LDLSDIYSGGSSTGYVTDELDFSPLSIRDSDSDVEAMEMSARSTERLMTRRKAAKTDLLQRLKASQATDFVIDTMPMFAPKSVHG
jgi:hypothetical protein